MATFKFMFWVSSEFFLGTGRRHFLSWTEILETRRAQSLMLNNINTARTVSVSSTTGFESNVINLQMDVSAAGM